MTYLTPRVALFGTLLFVAVSIAPMLVYAWTVGDLFDISHTNAATVGDTNSTNAQMTPLLKAALKAEQGPAGGGDVLIEDGSLVSYGDIFGKDVTASAKANNGEISVYVVRPGDTLSEIAKMFNISAKTILWANNISDGSKIRPGDSLTILPITGVRHVVKQGDTLPSIAKKYNADTEDILSYNQLSGEKAISVGDTVIVPDGVIETPKVQAKTTTKGTTAASRAGVGKVTGSGDGYYTNPLPGAIKTQGIHGFNAVDLAGKPVGTPVSAAASGNVIVAKQGGWNGGYGSYVVISHPNGTQTVYGHLSAVAVSVGQHVSAGQRIGALGNTGKSTGPHLHFEVRGARNPF